jgi:hypothetical protein
VADSQASLLEQVRSGGNRQLLTLAASGLLPIPPEDLLPVQVELARGDDAELARRATDNLMTVDPKMVAGFLERTAGEAALEFFAAHSTHFFVLETILRRRDVPRHVLVDLGRRISPDLQEILILRQDAILDEPEILDALEENPEISLYVERRITEYREHLLPQARQAMPAEAFPALGEEMADEEVVQAIEAVRALPAEGEVEEQTGLTEGQIRLLPIPARLKLTRNAPRSLRTILLRDSNPMVAVSTLHNNNLSDQEVEQTAASRSVVEEVLGGIAKRREWVTKYKVARALVANPRAPLAISLKLLNRMSVRDLKDLSRDKNIADAVRSTAIRLYRIKQQ